MATYRLDLATTHDAPFNQVDQMPSVEAATLDEALPRLLAKSCPPAEAASFWARVITSVPTSDAPGEIWLVYVKNLRVWKESISQAACDPLLLQSGGKQVMIDGTPLANQAEWFAPSQIKERHVELTQPVIERMVLSPRRSYRGILAVLIILWIAALIPFTVVELPDGNAVIWLFAALFAFPLLVLLWHQLGLTSWVFSRSDQQLIRRSIGRNREYPLFDVIAVQVCGGDRCVGWVQKAVVGDYFYQDLSPTYQLNLVFNGSAISRLLLTQQPDLDWALDSGKRLAEFLCVPCIVQGCAVADSQRTC
jgi:hypothetical protein